MTSRSIAEQRSGVRLGYDTDRHSSLRKNGAQLTRQIYFTVRTLNTTHLCIATNTAVLHEEDIIM